MATKDPKPDPKTPDFSADGTPDQGRPRSASGWGVSAQLSGARRVTGDVGSIALDRVLLVGGAASTAAEPPLRGALAEPGLLEMLSDAEVMLRVAAGDDGAFDYLVQKYRRQMISFMYRMTHNQAVAEELA
jgi:RNA polymerase sigma-70 factor (ECF subfamily)